MITELQSIKGDLENLKKIYNREIGILQKLQEDKKSKDEDIIALTNERAETEIQILLIQDASKEARKSATEVLQNMATNGLKFIMGDYMSLDINLDEERNPPTAEFVSISKYDAYTVEADPAEEEGGGVADVVALSTQYGMLQLAGKNNVAPFLLDEPSKYVSKGHSENVAKFLFETSRYFKRQVIMSTHDEVLAKIGDKAYYFQIDDKGRSKVTEL